MDFEWDEDKRAKNITKHGLDFADVELMDWASVTILHDTRKDYGEARYWGFPIWSNRLHVVTFVYRGEKIRIINFRRANRKEVAKYGKT